jgi:hypothetical protein
VLTREINAARERGIPIEPLVAKVREGRQKRASGTLIRGAVSSLIKRLDSARVALGAGASVDELSAAADALASGADVATLRAVRAATTRPIAVPIGTLAQLLASGVERKRAAELIVTLLRRNATPAQVIALGNFVEADVASGLRPDEAALFRMRGVEGTLSTGDKALTATVPDPSLPGSQHPTTKPHRSP